MLKRSNNNPDEEKDWLAIGRKLFRETNPFGYKDYKETFDNTGWWKIIEYTDENGKKVNQEINAIGQICNIVSVQIKENTGKKKEIKLDNALKSKPKKEICLDDALLEDWDFEDDASKKENEKNHMMHTPDFTDDNNILSQNDFFRMEWKETQYQLYRLLLNISSSLSNIQEVAKQNDK